MIYAQKENCISPVIPTEREYSVNSCLVACDKHQAAVEERVSFLLEKLDAVMAPCCPEPLGHSETTKPYAAQMSPLAERINALESRINETARRLGLILDRLDI